ncbi:MAG: PRC-barrel domain-containing protein [Patescibacteria group bacterium]
MQKLYSELIGMSVLTEYSATPVALIKDIIIDPDSGKVLAFRVNGQNIISSMDVESIGNSLIIADRDRIVPINEILRVESVAKMNISIIGARVIGNRSKKYIGRVVDYAIDTKHLSLIAIHCAKVFVFFRFNEKIFLYKNIVKISKHTVIVKDSGEILVSEKADAVSSAFAS